MSSDRNDSLITDDDTYKLNETIAKFYETYDVMTGVRIAATLGGFFGLMVILVLYKSKSKTERAMEDPDFTAAAVAEAEEEEERRLEAAVMGVASYTQLNPRKARRSLDTSSVPPGWGRTTRFSSVGGYSSLMEPPVRGASSRLPAFIDEDSPPPEEDRSLYDEVYYFNGHLEVPRRPSNITCSSSGSSYLERRDSSVTIGLQSAIPGYNTKPRNVNNNKRRPSSPLLEIYDLYYPIDIKVIQPTPGGSPCGSDRTLYAHQTAGPPQKLAPLASISSCNSSLGGTTVNDCCPESYMSDSVFNEDGVDDDRTDDEVDPFSTDSGATTNDNTSADEDEEDAEDRLKQSALLVTCSSKSSVTLVENAPGAVSLNADVSSERASGQLETLF